MKSTEDLAKAVGIPLSRVKRQIEAANDWRWKLRTHGKEGWTLQKRDGFLAMGRIPKWIWLHPEFKDTYFANDQDQHERSKNLEAFLKKYPEWARK